MADDGMVADTVLRLLSHLANADRSVLASIKAKELKLIVSRIAEPGSALILMTQIVKSGDTTIEELVEGGLVENLGKAIETHDLASIDLLFMILMPIAKQLSESGAANSSSPFPHRDGNGAGGPCSAVCSADLRDIPCGKLPWADLSHLHAGLDASRTVLELLSDARASPRR
jgi:hypothetical protein